MIIEIRFRIINVIILKSESWLHSSPTSRGPFINYVDNQGRRVSVIAKCKRYKIYCISMNKTCQQRGKENKIPQKYVNVVYE